jgi:hypothetical protein
VLQEAHKLHWEVAAMAKVIEFYIPDRFRRSTRWIPPQRRGKVLQFPTALKKTA